MASVRTEALLANGTGQREGVLRPGEGLALSLQIVPGVAIFICAA